MFFLLYFCQKLYVPPPVIQVVYGQHNFSSIGWGDLGDQAKPEIVYQNCVKLIRHGAAHKHSCALKSQNTCSITNFLPTSPTTRYEVKN